MRTPYLVYGDNVFLKSICYCIDTSHKFITKTINYPETGFPALSKCKNVLTISKLHILRKASAIKRTKYLSEICVPRIEGHPAPSLRHYNIRCPSILGSECRAKVRRVTQVREP